MPNTKELTTVTETEIHPMLREHVAGDSLRTIAARNGTVSHETVRTTVFRESTRFVDSVELQILVAWKYTDLGRADEAAWPVLLIPNQDQEDRALALRLLGWVLDRLSERGLKTKLVHTATPNGSAFMITAEEN
jgi:hypothetical protein